MVGDYKTSENAARDVVKDLFSRERERELKALFHIIENPDESYKKAILRFEKEVADPYVLASLVKALAAILREEAPKQVMRYLRHQDGRVRANSMEALASCGANLKEDPKILKVILNFLADPEPRVVTNCMRLLSDALDREQLLDLVHRYFDFEQDRICLNVLYMIRELKLTEGFDLVQKCLNHPSKKVRHAAEEMLNEFQAQHQEAQRLALRSPDRSTPDTAQIEADFDLEFAQTLESSNKAETDFELDMESDSNQQTADPMAQYARIVDKGIVQSEFSYDEELSNEYLKKLKELLKTKDTQAQIGLLFEIARHNVGGELLDFLREQLTAKPDAFITATLVKVVGILSNQDEWNTLSVFLNHRNLRVVSNTVEALVSRKDKRLIPHLVEKIDQIDINEAAQVRILTAGLPLLMEFEPESAIHIVDKLAQGNLGAIASLVMILQKWVAPPENIVQVAVDLLAKETRLEVTRSLCSFVEQWANTKQYEQIRSLVRELEPGSRKKVILESIHLMERRLGIEAHEKLDLDELTQDGAQDLQKAAEGFLKEKGHEVQTSKFSRTTVQYMVGFSLLLIVVTTLVFTRNQWMPWIVGAGSIASEIQRADQKSATSSPVDNPRRLVKGYGVISKLDVDKSMIVASGKETYELYLDNPNLIGSFQIGQKIKFVGEFLEKEITDEVLIRIRYVFEDTPFRGRKSS